jgi:FkbM family methyltransferase
MISYAQNREDVVLARAFRGQTAGFYVDVGAAHPTDHSVTKHFYDLGWSGINIEPHPEFFRLLRTRRPRDVNLNVGISDREGVLTFYEHQVLGGSSTFDADLAEFYRRDGVDITESEITVTTLSKVLEQHSVDKIDFLKIDVEGFEPQVLAGANLSRYRPRIVVIESIDPRTQEVERDGPTIAGYVATLFDGINRFYVDEEETDLALKVGVPANFLDDYVPVEVVKLRQERDKRSADLAAARVELDDIRSQLTVMTTKFERAHVEIGAARTAVTETRASLADARAGLRDARAEVSALRAVLVDDVVEEKH